MRIDVLGCGGGCSRDQRPCTFLVNGVVAVDAGSLATALSVEEQSRVTDVLLTHSHLDHVRDLPLTVLNRLPGAPRLKVHGLRATLDPVRENLFRSPMWFDAFDEPVGDPLLAAVEVSDRCAFGLDGLTVTPFAVPHGVPAVGYLLDDGRVAAAICADTVGGGVLENLPPSRGRLAAVFIEASFPDRMSDFARRTDHLTPRSMARECAALPPGVAVHVIHRKPGHEAEIAADVAASGPTGACLCVDGDAVEL